MFDNVSASPLGDSTSLGMLPASGTSGWDDAALGGSAPIPSSGAMLGEGGYVGELMEQWRSAAAMATVDARSPIPDWGGSADALTRSALPLTATDPLLPVKTRFNAVWSQTLDQVAAFAQSRDWQAKMAQTFGQDWAPPTASRLLKVLTTGRQMPAIQLAPLVDLKTQAAYSPETDTIFLAQEWLSHAVQTPTALVSVLLEELGHFIDDQLSAEDSPGDEGALFAAQVLGQPLSAADIEAFQAEDDWTRVTLNNRPLAIEQTSGGAGIFTVGSSGQITVEFRFDGGGYEGQLAVFSLTGMEALTPGSTDFIREAARRALSNTSEGYVVVADATEGAARSGELGEANRNQGKFAGIRSFDFQAGDQVALMLIPNGTVQTVFRNPGADGSLRPLFSLPSANPGGREQFGQLAATATGGVYGIEDLRFDQRSDGDYNDLIVSLQGATGQVRPLSALIRPSQNWLNTPLGQALAQVDETPPGASPDPDPTPDPAPKPKPIPSPSPEPGPEPEPVPAPIPDPSPEPEPDPGPISEPEPDPISSGGDLIRDIDDTVAKFSASSSEAQIAASGASRITLGSRTIYIGTNQVSSLNQNPIIASFDSANPANNWVRTDYEVTGADGRGIGLASDGQNLYAVFTVDGTQGAPSEDFRRATGGTEQSWLRSYGQGGGAKVSVIGRIDPATGALLDAAYLSAILSDGDSNTLVVNDIAVNESGNLVLSADSYFAPRRPDGQPLTRVTSAGSPFNYTLEITPDLKRVVSTRAVGWV